MSQIKNVSKTGLAYLQCADIPGDESTSNGIVQSAHRVYWYRVSMSKPVYPAYNGLLNSSGQVTVNSFDVLINQQQAELFKTICGGNKVLDKVEIMVLSSYGMPSSVAQLKLKIELSKASITYAKSNAPFSSLRVSGPNASMTNELVQQSDSRYGSFNEDDENTRDFSVVQKDLLKLKFVFDQATFIYYPVATDSTPQGQMATTFKISTNEITAA